MAFAGSIRSAPGNAIFSPDLGYFDVPDMRMVLPEPMGSSRMG